MNSEKPAAIDCFAGAGGMSLGLQQAGFDVVYAFDSDKDAVQTYCRNVGLAEVRKAEQLTGTELLKSAGLERGQCMLMAGGPPCQGFSRQRRGFDRDERNDLVFEFMRLVSEVSPNVFLMENVPAMRAPRGLPFFSEVCRRAVTAGYRVSHNVLDAAAFGVPQHRKRLFIVGFREPAIGFTFPDATHAPLDFVTVANAIGDLPSPLLAPDLARAIPNHEPDNVSALNRLRISHVPPGGGRADIPPKLQLPCHSVSVDKAGHRGVYGRLASDRPAGTITTKCNSFTRGRFAHPVENRNISMREAARLQSFADGFIFDGDKVSVAHQIGNAVPPRLARSLGEALLRALKCADGCRSGDEANQLTLAL